MLLPKKVGNLTLMRRLRSNGITESYAAIMDEPAGCQVVARRLLPHLLREPAQRTAIEQRAQDLVGVRHDAVVPVLDYVAVGEERYLLEEWVDAISLDRFLAYLREHGRALPHNILLHLATQVCNGLEALHNFKSTSSTSEQVLHNALSANGILLRSSGQVILGGYGLVRSPTTNPPRGSGSTVNVRLENLSPEQTHPQQALSPSSDIFSLGTILYEMLTLKTMFRAKSNLQTIHRIRRAEVTSHLLEAKELLPGVDRVLYRALSLNPRHRYQRAFVLREDLRGLMAGFSFANIDAETCAILKPLFEARGADAADGLPALPPDPGESTASLLEPLLRSPAESVGAQHVAPPIVAAAPTQKTRIKTETGASYDGPEEGAFESEASTDVRDPSHVPALTPEVSADDAPASLADGDSTTWFQRLTPHAGPASLTDAPPPPVKAQASGTTAAPGGSGEHHRHAPTAFDDEVQTEVKGTLRPLASAGTGARPNVETRANASGDEGTTPGVTPRPPSADETQIPKNPNEMAAATTATVSVSAGESTTASFDEDPDTVVGVGPAPSSAVITSVVAADEDLDEDLQWRQSNNSGLLMGFGGAAVALALSIVLCMGLGGTGAVLGTSGTLGDNVSIAEPSASPDPRGGDGEVTVTKRTPADEVLDAVDDETPEVMATASAEGAASNAAASQDTRSPVQAATKPTPIKRPMDAPSVSRAGARRAAAAVTDSPSPHSTMGPKPEFTTASVSRSPAILPATASPPPPEVDAVAEAVPQPIEPPSLAEMSRYADDAYSGQLSSLARAALSEVSISDEDAYTRAHALLYQDARARNSLTERASLLAALFQVAANRYRPELLVEDAELAVQQKEWRRALDQVARAEQHWARMPSELMFTRMAMVHEVRAQASLGRFYDSDGTELDALSDAIRGWTRYRDHVARRERSDLLARADKQLTRLYDIQERMQ